MALRTLYGTLSDALARLVRQRTSITTSGGNGASHEFVTTATFSHVCVTRESTKFGVSGASGSGASGANDWCLAHRASKSRSRRQ